MIKPKAFICALKTTWIRRFRFDKHKWTKIIGNHINMDNFLDCGTEYITKILKKNIKNQFWLDVFNAYIEVQSNNQPKEIHEFQGSAIFTIRK